MHGAAHRANVLRAYRELLTLVRGLPSARREGALAEARAGVRANAAEPDAGKASDQLKQLFGRISFLRTVRVLWERCMRRPRALRRCVSLALP